MRPTHKILMCCAAGGALLAACSGEGAQDLRAGLPANNVVDRCATPNDDCPCAQPGSEVSCGSVKDKSVDYTLCQYGARRCEANGRWGTCVIPGDARLAYVGFGLGLSLNGLGTPVNCGNVCDPNCIGTQDTPLGLDASIGTTVADSGLTLASTGGSVAACTGIHIEMAEGTSLDTATGPLWSPPAYATLHVTSMVMPSVSAGKSADLPLPLAGSALKRVVPADPTSNSYVPFKAVFDPPGCDSDGPRGAKFNAVQWSTSLPAYAAVGDRGLVGSENVSALYLFGSVGGAMDVKLQAGTFAATLPLHLQVDVDLDLGLDGMGMPRTPQIKATMTGVETPANAASTWLYPLQNTLYPLGLEAPTLMWNKPSTAPENAAANFHTALVHKDAGGREDFRFSVYGTERSDKPRATSEWLDGEARYAAELATRNLLKRPGGGAAAWAAFERTTAALASPGVPGVATVELARKAGAVLARSPDLNLSFVNEAMQGRVYFTSYGERRDTSTASKWDAIWPLEKFYDTKQQAVASTYSSNFCPTCHSVSGNGKVFLSVGRGLGYGTYAAGISYVTGDGAARGPWDVTDTTVANDTCNSAAMISGTEASRKLCRSNNYGTAGGGDRRVTDGATLDQLRNSDATRADWFDSDVGQAMYGDAAPAHTWDWGTDRIRNQGQGSSLWVDDLNTDAGGTGTHKHGRRPHGRSDGANGAGWAALTFDGRFFLQGNSLWGNTWGESQNSLQKDRFDGSPFLLMEIGRPIMLSGSSAATVNRWSSFRSSWNGLARCQDSMSGTPRFWCDVTPNSVSGVSGLTGKPLVLPVFSPPSNTAEGAAQTGEVFAAILGGPTSAYGLGGSGATAATAVVVAPVTRGTSAFGEAVEGASGLAARTADGLSVGTLAVAASLAGAERYQSVTIGGAGDQLVAQVGTGRLPGTSNGCHDTGGNLIREYMRCKNKNEAGFDPNVDHKGAANRYREMLFPTTAVPHCYDTSGGEMPRVLPCDNATDTFHDRDAHPTMGTFQRSSASTYMVSVCRGASGTAGVYMSDALSPLGSFPTPIAWYAYVTGDSSQCTAAQQTYGSVTALNASHPSKPRRSVCENDDTYMGLRPFTVLGVTTLQHVCAAMDRYEVIRCTGGASPTYQTVVDGALAVECLTTRATAAESSSDKYIGPGDAAQPMSYCVRADSSKYRVHGCSNVAAAGKWVKSVCDDGANVIGTSEDADCRAASGRFIDARGGLAGSGFGWVDSYMQKASAAGGSWQSTPLLNASPASPATTVATRKDYFPSLYGERVGGFNWLLFSSARPYGNAYSNDVASPIAGLGANNEAALCGGSDITKTYAQTLLWGSALDAPSAANAGLDTSHAPFLLPGQEFGLVCANSSATADCATSSNPDCMKRQVSLSERPVWVKSACSPTILTGNGSASAQCDDNGDCCDSAAKCSFDLPATSSDPYTGFRHCRVPAPVCAGPTDNRTGLACATNADCCGLSCSAYICQAAPCAPQYTSGASYDRVYAGSCKTGQRVSWSFVEWSGDAPNNSSVRFYVAGGTTESGARSVATDGVLVGSETSRVAISNQLYSLTSLSSSDSSSPWLRLRMKLAPSTTPDACSAPSVSKWRVAYTCLDNE